MSTSIQGPVFMTCIDGFQNIFLSPIYGETVHVHVHPNESTLKQHSNHERPRYNDSDLI
jgi:hypothetical protein